MLKPELARKQLAELKTKKPQQARIDRLKKLPKAAAEAGLAVFGRNADGKIISDYDARSKAEEAGTASLQARPADRAKVFAALFPTIAADVEAGWQLFERLPYTVGYLRRGFRAPGRPELYNSRRQSWLEGLFDTLAEISDDTLTASWLAEWAVHLDDRDALGVLLAAAIDRPDQAGEAILEIIKDTAASRHPIGGPGRHATQALLSCARPEAWEFAEGLLRAAQRQEGLRQAILESVDEAHPQAFPRMVRLILNENMIRFSSVARAAGVWLGEDESALEPKKLKADLTQMLELMEDAAKREKAIAKGDARTCYRGLWADALTDVTAAAKRACLIVKEKQLNRRYAAARFLRVADLPDAAPAFVSILAGNDLHLIGLVLPALDTFDVYGEFGDGHRDTTRWPADMFERLEKLIARLPEKEKVLKPIAPGWEAITVSQEVVANQISDYLGNRPPERLLPHLAIMGPWAQVHAIGKLCEPRTLTAKVRQTLLTVAGHPSGNIREAALKGLKKCKIAEDEAQTLEGYLTRKTADLRRGLFELLLNRTDKAAVGSVERLIGAKDANQRLAGLEIARRLVEAERQPAAVRKVVAEYRDNARKLAKVEAEAVEVILDTREKPPSLDNCLGLINPADRTPPTPPTKRKVTFSSPAAVALIRELDEFIHEHREKTFVPWAPAGPTPEPVVLGSAAWYQLSDNSDKRPLDAFPLADLWQAFWKQRSTKAKDKDGLELIRALGQPTVEVREGEEEFSHDYDFDDDDDDDRKKSTAETAALKAIAPIPPVGVRYDSVVGAVVPWLVTRFATAKDAEFLLDAAEASLALVPHDLLSHIVDPEDWQDSDWRDSSKFVERIDGLKALRSKVPWKPEYDVRVFGLQRWIDEPGTGVGRKRPDWNTLQYAYAAGGATLADIYDELIGPRGSSRGWYRSQFSTLAELTNAEGKLPEAIAGRKEVREAVDRCVARILEIELARGESPTAATEAAKSIASLHGAATLFRVLRALGKLPFAKQSYSVGDNKPSIFTHFIRICHPQPEDTPEQFAATSRQAIEAGEIPEDRILEVATVNPRWVTHVERTLGWPGLAEAIYWLMAHSGANVDLGEESNDPPAEGEGEAKPKNAWAEIVKARTNLTSEQLSDGVIDVAWFHSAYQGVGSDKRWDAIESASKHLGYGQAHKNAARLADVLLGRTKKKDLVDSIRGKFLKESVRLLGLLPLPADAAKREAELGDRHKVLKEYERYARGLGSMSREPAMQAARLGLENLAVTAGFPDPLRLEWAVGAKAVADLGKGPVRATALGVTVELTLGDFGVPELSQSRDGKPLKSLPTEVRKNAKVAELVERRNDLKKSASSYNRSMELAMCQGDAFTGAEVRQLMGHALVRPVLERLVLQADGLRGYPTPDGKALRDFAGKTRPLAADARVTIAHPMDLLEAGDWHDWQAECFRSERLQPFKQVFRELYTVTAQEKEDGTISRRYAGQQLNPSQAMALFGARGWSTREGVDKLYREAGLVVSVQFDSGWSTPGEVEGQTVRGVQFHRRGDWKPALLTDVPARVFSEVMRDLDLVVSVAHVGGVDPEASASTVDMRAMLVKETCALLKLNNVRIDSRHAMIDGSLGKYSVHMGSGVVHKQPGGALCVVPVHSQHRGRLFLPFADDDPRTAEVVSKVLLLARDQEIQDPTILEQIAGR